MNILRPSKNPDKKVRKGGLNLFNTQIIHILLGKKQDININSETEQTNESDLILIKQLQELGINPQDSEIEKYKKMNLDFEKLKQLQELGIKISSENIEKFNKLELDIEIIKKLKEIGITDMTDGYRSLRRYIALGLTNEDIEFIQENNLTNYNEIYYFLTLKNNTNKKTISEYLLRKHKYLENHRTISEEKFIELFGGKGKYGKTEINQERIRMCYAYTGFEILKKLNCFDELIQTNLRETSDLSGWEVRFPMGDPNGKRIKVYRDEIDQKFTKTNKKTGEKYEASVNSNSEFLGFKILEIAFMKISIINASRSQNRLKYNVDYNIINKAISEYESTGKITFNEKLINCLEGGYVNDLYKTIISTGTDGRFTPLIRKGKSVTGNIMDLIFNFFNKGMTKVEVGILPIHNINIDNKRYEIVEEDGIIVHNAKIIHKNGEIQKTSVQFIPKHSYSIEKCYIDSDTGEKRVWIVNPRDTGIKYDISFEDAKTIFEWDITKLNIDKMFQEQRA